MASRIKKDSLGCPYANKDYRTTNPEYGTMDDFKSLVEKIHAKGMKCIIDVVYNHTSPDSNLSVEHPEFFYRKPDGNFGNKVGDWSDIIDLDYSNKELWRYQIDSLVMWARIVDGFRCDVASFVPVEFWKQAREAVSKVIPTSFGLPKAYTALSMCSLARAEFIPQATMSFLTLLIWNMTTISVRFSTNI